MHNPAGEPDAAFLVSAGYLTADLIGGTYTWTQGTNGNIVLNCTLDVANPTPSTIYNIAHSSSALNNTVKEIATSFADFLAIWMKEEKNVIGKLSQ